MRALGLNLVNPKACFDLTFLHRLRRASKSYDVRQATPRAVATAAGLTRPPVVARAGESLLHQDLGEGMRIGTDDAVRVDGLGELPAL